ncbi:P-loop containing nucleoside triphosphate hydrolase protein [Ascobolus immersus RN42]|uniref:ATP-dependent RNA helicase n=1 Tax=Ascobolus immersus RN42 TaxID=1160509 RepID=A0A3N4IJ25_ASCIM|nr:P-loop containing nucleoside triphosphate hydrolase protein [Ascobolus immersus RN42]
MAPTNPKKRSAASLSSPTNKKSKTASRINPANQSKKPRAIRKAVNVNRLRWNTVPLPDRLDDTEGFMGLEEIEGVDIVKENGVIKFQAVEDAIKDDGEPSEDEAELDGEWEGIKDDDVEMEAEKEDTTTTTTAIPQENSTEEDGNEAEMEQEPEIGEMKGGVVTKGEDGGAVTKDAKAVRKELVVRNDDEESKRKREKAEKRKEAQKLRMKEKNKREREEKKKRKEEERKKAAEAEPKMPENPFELLGEDMDDGDVDLPEWKMRLSVPTSRALVSLKYTKPTRIQEVAIPQILAGHDVIGKAATGSGKTLAYGVPILEYFLETRPPDLGTEENKKKASKFVALVLSPTRELAKQISTHIEELSKAALADMNVVTLTGGLSLQKQLRVLEHAHVIVATPGRLWEVMTEGPGWVDRFKDAHFLVVDEADRVLQEGHFEEVEKVLKVLNEDIQEESDDEAEEAEREAAEKDDDGAAIEELNYGKSVKVSRRRKLGITRQTLVFSATFHKGLQMKLAGKASKKGWNESGDLMEEKESMAWLLKRLQFREEKPRWIDIEGSKGGMMAEGLKEGIVECGAMEKDLYLYYLLLRYPSRTLIFTNSISSVKRLSPMLNLLLPGKASPLHSTMPQKSRLRYLERFSDPNNKNGILIATDVAARGLDIKGVEMVIHYHVPRTADMYVHRSGRTARAGDKGISVILCSPEEVLGVRRLVTKVHQEKGSKNTSLKSFDVDRTLTSRLKRRVELAKKITDAEVSTKKQGAEENWIAKAAEELGVDYDSDEFEKHGMGRGKGKGKDKKGRNDKVVGKQQVAEWKAMLREELSKKVNAGFSTKYLTSGSVNVAQMLTNGMGMDGFLGLEERSAIEEIHDS